MKELNGKVSLLTTSSVIELGSQLKREGIVVGHVWGLVCEVVWILQNTRRKGFCILRPTPIATILINVLSTKVVTVATAPNQFQKSIHCSL